MTILQFAASYLLTTVVFFAVDMLWLGVVAKNFYFSNLGDLLRSSPNWTAAIIFYLVFIVGIFLFAILPALERQSLQHAIVYGALFGFFTYATYDFTNLATLKGWPLNVVIVDVLWGTILTGTVATAGYYIGRWISHTL